MIHDYNIIGCWIFTVLLAYGKINGKVDVSWLAVSMPVLIINGWLMFLSIYKRVKATFGKVR